MKFLALIIFSCFMPILSQAEVHCSAAIEAACSGSPDRGDCLGHINNIFSEGSPTRPADAGSVDGE